MDVAEVIILALIIFLLGLAALGFLARRRQLERTDEQFHARVEEANRDLAAAHAADNGWEPALVEAAARAAFGTERPDVEIERLALVQVIDPPGTDDDRAVWRVRAGGADQRLTLGRRDGEWVLESLEDVSS